MGRIVKVRLWTHDLRPLLADVEEDELVGYKRRTIGFLPPDERDEAYEQVHRRGAVRPPVGHDHEEAEGEWVDIEGEEEAEDES